LHRRQSTRRRLKQTKEDIILQPKAWVRYHIKNVNPLNSGDRIKVHAFDYSFVGTKIDTTILSDGIYGGNQYNNIYWYVTRNYILKPFKDSVFIKGVDTLDYYIKY
jgi:hypothetical protein